MTLDRITIDHAVMEGRACIRGMRISVALVMNLLANGMSRDEIRRNYPVLEDETLANACVMPRCWPKSRSLPSSSRALRFLIDMGIGLDVAVALWSTPPTWRRARLSWSPTKESVGDFCPHSHRTRNSRENGSARTPYYPTKRCSASAVLGFVLNRGSRLLMT